MVNVTKRRSLSRGFSMIEVLVALVIIMLGLLGLLGVQVKSHQAEFESYQRSQALILVSDMVERVNANRKAAGCYETGTGMPYVGSGNTVTPTCTAYGTAALQSRAVADLTAWDGLLKGSAETSGGSNVGAMIGARGCVAFNAVTNEWRVSVAWQGLSQTIDPNDVSEGGNAELTCGEGQYGNDRQRRIVSQVFRIADLK